MINGSTGLMVLGILVIALLMCRYSYWLGTKKAKKHYFGVRKNGVYKRYHISAPFPSTKTINGKEGEE